MSGVTASNNNPFAGQISRFGGVKVAFRKISILQVKSQTCYALPVVKNSLGSFGEGNYIWGLEVGILGTWESWKNESLSHSAVDLKFREFWGENWVKLMGEGVGKSPFCGGEAKLAIRNHLANLAKSGKLDFLTENGNPVHTGWIRSL